MMGAKLNGSYQERRDHLSRLIEKLNSRKIYLQRISRIYSNYRLLIFITEVIIFFILFFGVSDVATLISFAVFFAVFSVLTHYHNKLDRDIKKLELWIKIKTDHLARLNLDWENISPLNNITQTPEINEVDLDLSGNYSLLQLINTGTSEQSKLMLREWLNSKIHHVDEIIERQELIKELIPLTVFRDKLALNSILSSRLEFSGDLLYKLLSKNEASSKSLKIIFVLLSVLAPLNLLMIVLYLWNILPAYWGISTLIYILLSHYGNKEKVKIMYEADLISDKLKKIAGVFIFLENYRYKTGSKLSKLCEPFKLNKRQPSFLINKIKNSVEFLRIRKGNPFVWFMITTIFPVDIYFKLRLNKYKHIIEGELNIWMDAWYKLEALCSLANFAYINPDYTFPEIIENDENKIIFRGKQLGHPLIKNEDKVCNDFSFNPDGEIALITGSNMSGKSTFVRTLGINLSLAYAGSVVNADKLEVSLFDLFTSIKVNDSIKDGISFFYAEVKRLKALLDEIEKSEYPVFFLIDEIFRGTNNIERLKGSSMLIKKLTETNAAGAVATHDLELVKLSKTNIKVRNYHFKEEIIDGKMIFDYLLNTGPCLTTNALKIMKLEGLPVEE